MFIASAVSIICGSHRILVVVAMSCLISPSLLAQSEETAAEPQARPSIKDSLQRRMASSGDYEFQIEKYYEKHEYMVPMRDGIKLYTAVYTPKDTSKS